MFDQKDILRKEGAFEWSLSIKENKSEEMLRKSKGCLTIEVSICTGRLYKSNILQLEF